MIQIKPSCDGKYHFVIKSANGHELMRSTNDYTSLPDTHRGIKAMLKAIQGEDTALLTDINDYLKQIK